MATKKYDPVVEDAEIDKLNIQVLETYRRGKPTHVLYGLREDNHYSHRLQDEIEIELLYSIEEAEDMIKDKSYKWKEVQVYKLSNKSIITVK